jgi:hypothetical protein
LKAKKDPDTKLRAKSDPDPKQTDFGSTILESSSFVGQAKELGPQASFSFIPYLFN